MIHYQAENQGKPYNYGSNLHRNWWVGPHIHEFSEIIYTIEGMTVVNLNGCRYEVPKNHLIFILPNHIHEYPAECESYLRCAVFSNDFVPLFFEWLSHMDLKNPVVDLSEHTWLMEELGECKPEDILKIGGLLTLLCDLVLKNTEPVAEKIPENMLLYQVFRYVSKNFKQNITLKGIAKELGYHEKYLSSQLHATLRMNFRTFLASYRVDCARHDLVLKEKARLSVAQIAFENGFSSINTFNRMFKEIIGMTPTQYRKQKTER